MLNFFTINGRLVSDPKKSETGKSGYATLAVQRDYKNSDGEYDTDFFSLYINGEKAIDAWCKYFSKGDGVTVKGSLRTAKNKEGEGTHVILTVGFPEFGTVAKKAAAPAAKPASTTPKEEFEDIDDADEDLPF